MCTRQTFCWCASCKAITRSVEDEARLSESSQTHCPPGMGSIESGSPDGTRMNCTLITCALDGAAALRSSCMAKASCNALRVSMRPWTSHVAFDGDSTATSTRGSTLGGSPAAPRSCTPRCTTQTSEPTGCEILATAASGPGCTTSGLGPPPHPPSAANHNPVEQTARQLRIKPAITDRCPERPPSTAERESSPIVLGRAAVQAGPTSADPTAPDDT